MNMNMNTTTTTRGQAQAIRAARDESTGILEITAYAQLFAIGDVHGDLPRLVSVLHAIGVVALDHDDRVRWVAPPGTVVVQVGDQIDSEVRDPGAEDPDWETSEGSNDLHVVEFMTAIREIAERAGSMVVSCIGNHEWMNLSGDFSYVSPASIRASGGAESRRRLLASQRAGPYVQRHFAHREIACRVGRYLFSHAGIRPWHIARLGPAVRDFRRWVRGESHGMSEQTREFLSHPDGPLWTREFTGAGSANSRNGTDTVLRALRAEKMVVGHTVVPVATWFGKVLAIDTGMSRSLGGNDAFVLSSSVWRGDAILRVGFGRTGRIEKGRDVDVDVTDERAYTRFSVPWTE